MKKESVFKIYNGDVNGFFGLLLNNLTNFIALSGILLGVGITENIVFGRIIPGAAFACLVGSIFYFYMACKLSKKTNRSDVTALPIGISVPHMFIITFVIIVPVLVKTNDPIKAWQAAMAWSFIEGVIEIIGAFIGPYVRKKIPRAALLGSLAGVSLIFIALPSMLTAFQKPYLSFISFGILFLAWFNNKGYIKKIPTGLLIILVGMAIGLITKTIDINNLKSISFHINLPQLYFNDLIEGLKNSWSLIATALPFGIYNFFETMDNLESASAAGDEYDTRKSMLIDGFTTMLGVSFGSGFPTALYIGHAGWKKVGSKKMYVLMTGVGMFLLAITNTLSFLYNLIPIESILPILVYIGIIITEQAFSESKKQHYPAIVLAILPWIASWGLSSINTAISFSKFAKEDTINMLIGNGIPYKGLEAYGSGAIIVSILWASILVFIIDDNIKNAIFTSLLAAILSFVGIIHSAKIELMANMNITIGYLVLVALFSLVLLIKINNNKQINLGDN